MSILKGSKRCILELISSRNFTTEINMLLNPTGAVINPSDVWMPKGIHNDIEAELKDFLSDNFSNQLGSDIFHWWLAFPSQETKTPNWDFVSTCTINNQKGIILVEGKAHLDELQNESKGKILRSDASENSIANHYKIGKAIEESKITKEPVGKIISRLLAGDNNSNVITIITPSDKVPDMVKRRGKKDK